MTISCLTSKELKRCNGLILENIQRYRIIKGLTRYDIINYLGISEDEYKIYENGDKYWDMQQLIKISYVCSVPVFYLLTDRNFREKMTEQVSLLYEQVHIMETSLRSFEGIVEVIYSIIPPEDENDEY